MMITRIYYIQSVRNKPELITMSIKAMQAETRNSLKETLLNDNNQCVSSGQTLTSFSRIDYIRVNKTCIKQKEYLTSDRITHKVFIHILKM